MELYSKQHYSEAAKEFECAYNCDRNEMDTLSSRRYNSLQWMNHCLFMSGGKDEYLPYYSKQVPIDRQLTYAIDSILTHANDLNEHWKFSSALIEYKKTLEMAEREFGTNNALYSYCIVQYFDCLSTIATFQRNIEDIYGSIKMALMITDKFHDGTYCIEDKYYDIMSDLSFLMRLSGDYQSSLRVIIKASCAEEDFFSMLTPRKVKFLKESSSIYFEYMSLHGFERDDIDNAIYIGRKIEDIYKNQKSFVNDRYFHNLDVQKINVQDFAENMYYLSLYGLKINEYDFALEKAVEGIKELQKHQDGDDDKYYGPLFNNYSFVLCHQGDTLETLKLQNQLLAFHKKKNLGGRYNTNIEGTLKSLVHLHHNYHHDVDSVTYYASLYYEHFKQTSYNKFLETENQTISYWNQEIHYIEQLCRYATFYSNRELLEILYNTLLIGNGFLLKTGNAIYKIAESSSDSELQQLVNRLDSLLLKNGDVKDIEAVKYNIKRRCIKEDMLEQPTYKDISSKLDAKSLAVEFFYYLDQDTIHYCALVAKKDTEYPLLAKCFSFNKDEIPILSLDKVSSYKIWSSIMPHTKGIKNIYITTSGILQTVPIENMPSLYRDKLMCEEFNIFRLSSSSELVNKRNNKDVYSISLYGGLFYSSDDECEILDDNTSNRGAIATPQYLPMTKKEIEEISRLCSKSHFEKVNINMGYEGDIISFLNLSNSDCNVLHIATHGYCDIQDGKGNLVSTDLLSEPSSDKLDETYALKASGLYLSIAEDEQENKITAYEIAKMNLRKTDLVCLSACDTGNGIHTSDGVFGLQRGFKKAGVNSILMSLWKVDDAATCKLMTEFYSNWITHKMTKHDALEVAKKTVRETPGWEDPKYWAAFILLDGLD